MRTGRSWAIRSRFVCGLLADLRVRGHVVLCCFLQTIGGVGAAGSPCIQRPAIAEQSQDLLLVVSGVLLDKFLLVFRNIFQRVNRV